MPLADDYRGGLEVQRSVGREAEGAKRVGSVLIDTAQLAPRAGRGAGPGANITYAANESYFA